MNIRKRILRIKQKNQSFIHFRIFFVCSYLNDIVFTLIRIFVQFKLEREKGRVKVRCFRTYRKNDATFSPFFRGVQSLSFKLMCAVV